MIVLKFKKEIKGDCTVSNHVDSIVLESYAFNVSKHVQVQGKERPSSPAFMSEIMFTKGADVSSPNLFSAAIQGSSLEQAELVVLHTDGANKNMPLVTIVLSEPIISSFSTQATSGSKAAEHFSLNFTAIDYKYHVFDGAKAGTTVEKKYDLTTKEAK